MQAASGSETSAASTATPTSPLYRLPAMPDPSMWIAALSASSRARSNHSRSPLRCAWFCFSRKLGSYTFTPFRRRETELPGLHEMGNPDVVSFREKHRDLVHAGRLRGGIENDPDHLVRHRSRVGGPRQQHNTYEQDLP